MSGYAIALTRPTKPYEILRNAGAQVAGGEVAGADLAHEGRLDPATGLGIGAASVEMAAGRRAHRAWHVALQDDALGLGFGVGDRDGGKQGLGVGVLRRRE